MHQLMLLITSEYHPTYQRGKTNTWIQQINKTISLYLYIKYKSFQKSFQKSKSIQYKK